MTAADVVEIDESELDMAPYGVLADLGTRLGILMDDRPPLEVLRLRIKRTQWQ